MDLLHLDISLEHMYS